MDYKELVIEALKEDHASFDVTSQFVEKFFLNHDIKFSIEKSFAIVAKESAYFCGQSWLHALTEATGVQIKALKKDGEFFEKGAIVVKGKGPWKSILAMERTLLNGLQHLSGITSQTRSFVEAVNRAAERFPPAIKALAEFQPKVYHTRKTLPLNRIAQIDAVLAGGGAKHRTNLEERVLLKENHKQLVLDAGVKWLDFIKALVESAPEALIEVENKTEALLAIKAGAKNILCDNFSPERLAETLREIPSQCSIEVSGGLNLQTIEYFVQPGVRRLSVGALTHSVRALDLSLDWAS